MISSKEALNIVLNQKIELGVERVNIEDSTGRILASPLIADRDFPPFDRVCMDGIAICYSSYEKGNRLFKIEGTQFAGQEKLKLNDESECIEIMTGAVLPQGTDTIVQFEHLEKEEGYYRIIQDIKAGINIHGQGSDRKKGTRLLSESRIIGPKEIGVLATIGAKKVKVFKTPAIAVISTGDELVDVGESPALHQIRMSNSHMLRSQLLKLGWNATLYHMPDNRETLRNKLTNVFQENQIVLFSGGVSKGKADYVPEILEELGIQKLFHRVRQRPGKPFWLGRTDTKLVFAFPGNPVSSFVCFLKYFRPWFYKIHDVWMPETNAVLDEDFSFKPELTYFLQVASSSVNGTMVAAPVEGNGSGDLANLLDANGLLELPSDRVEFKKGERFPYIEF